MFMKLLSFLIFSFCLLFHFLFVLGNNTDEIITEVTGYKSSILFTTLGRARYAFDVFSLPLSSISSEPLKENRITDGKSVNYNGFFPEASSFLYESYNSSLASESTQSLVYISERNGSFNIYLQIYPKEKIWGERRSFLELPNNLIIPLLKSQENGFEGSMKDRPSISGDNLVYVSTHQKSEISRKSWAAVYSTHLKTGITKRLTPLGIADFSPSVSPSCEWTAVASSGERGWTGEVEDLNTSIYIFKTLDGSNRIKVVDHGGWPCWFDESTLFFHRWSEDGWWSIYKATFPSHRSLLGVDSVLIERVTGPGIHAFTPATSKSNKNFIAVATRRSTSEFRHIELYDLVQRKFIELTRRFSPNYHHYNPFISPDATQIGYHKCRGRTRSDGGNSPLLLENLKSPSYDISLFRIDGSFPSFSHDGKMIAFVGLPGVYVVNSDGSNLQKISDGYTFATAWDWKRKGVIYTSQGPTFASESKEVDIISFDIFSNSPNSYKKLTTNGRNNAFPSPSPDGKWVVFRSGRTGHKNLYIMDAIEGEKTEIRRLTEGPWTDTMCNWSPNGEWIAFASDRDNPGAGSFAIYMIHPNGTGLKKVVESGAGGGGRANHPWFSPDSANFVFTSDYAGVSAEPIANPHHYQPYGDIFTAKIDGSEIRRLTHNSYEDGTPAWGKMLMVEEDVATQVKGSENCQFDDCHWLSSKHGILS